MRTVLVPVGSSGDVLPMVAVGAELRRRGHDVVVLTSPFFRREVEAAELTLEPMGTEDDYLAAARDPRLWHPTGGFKVIARELVGPRIGEQHDQVRSLLPRGGDGSLQRCVVVGSILALGARLLHDTEGVPFVTVHLQPSVLRSVVDPPWFGMPMPRSRLGRRAFWRLTDLLFVDRFLRGPINAERSRRGLAPIAHVDPWWHSPRRVVGLFPSWFAAPPPDWPANVTLTGFPLADGGDGRPVPAELDAWLGAGPAPIVFTFGSAMMHAEKLFAAAARACGQLQRRGLLLTQFPAQLPRELAEGVRHFDYAPFREVFPRCAAVVHHGGIGTTAQALAAGVPQLIVPHSHDQPDNARRVERLNAGAMLSPRRAASATALTRTLGAMLVDERMRAAGAACANRMREPEQALAAACDAIEAEAGD